MKDGSSNAGMADTPPLDSTSKTLMLYSMLDNGRLHNQTERGSLKVLLDIMVSTALLEEAVLMRHPLAVEFSRKAHEKQSSPVVVIPNISP